LGFCLLTLMPCGASGSTSRKGVEDFQPLHVWAVISPGKKSLFNARCRQHAFASFAKPFIPVAGYEIVNRVA